MQGGEPSGSGDATAISINDISAKHVLTSNSHRGGPPGFKNQEVYRDLETQHAFLEETALAMQSHRNKDFNIEFDNLVNRILRRLEEIEKKWVLGEYDFDDVAVDPYAIKFENLQDTM